MTPILAMFMAKDVHFYSTHAIDAQERANNLRDHHDGEKDYRHGGHRHHHRDNSAFEAEELRRHHGSHDDLTTGAIQEEEFYRAMVYTLVLTLSIAPCVTSYCFGYLQETYAIVVCATAVVAMVVIIAGLCGLCVVKRYMKLAGVPREVSTPPHVSLL